MDGVAGRIMAPQRCPGLKPVTVTLHGIGDFADVTTFREDEKIIDHPGESSVFTRMLA